MRREQVESVYVGGLSSEHDVKNVIRSQVPVQLHIPSLDFKHYST